MSTSSGFTTASLTDVLDESVHTSDDQDIGDIEAISRDFVVVKRGFRKIHYYYLPISTIEGWDGHVVWLKITEEDVKRNFERNRAPDPASYYFKESLADQPKRAPPAAIHRIRMIPSDYKLPDYGSLNAQEASRINTCALCGSSFDVEDELSNHVGAKH